MIIEVDLQFELFDRLGIKINSDFPDIFLFRVVCTTNVGLSLDQNPRVCDNVIYHNLILSFTGPDMDFQVKYTKCVPCTTLPPKSD